MGLHVKVSVNARQLDDGTDYYRKLSRGIKRGIDKALQELGDHCVEKLKTEAEAGAYGPPKVRGSGPPLIKTHNYISSFRATVKGGLLSIGPTGMNERMSNEALGELLEYGSGGIPARPHMRPMTLYIERIAAEFLGPRILRLVLCTWALLSLCDTD